MKIIKIFFLLLIINNLNANGFDESIERMKKQNVKEILKDFDYSISNLIKQNYGKLKMNEYQYLIGISTFITPPTINWNIMIDIDEYESDLKLNLAKQYDIQSQTYKEYMKKIKEGFIKDLIKNNIDETTYNSSCNRDDYKYIFSRNISMIFTFYDKKNTFLGKTIVNNNICKKRELILK